MLTKEEVKMQAENFGDDYFFSYSNEEWKKIKNYGDDVPIIVKCLCEITSKNVELEDIDPDQLFKIVMEDIKKL